MIAIMTWSDELNNGLKDGLNDSSIINSVEELTQNINKFNKVILKRHQSWTLESLESMIDTIKILGNEIYYIAKTGDADETKLLIKLDIKNIIYEPMDADEIIRKVKFSDIQDIGLFDEDLYDDEPINVVDTKDIEEDIRENEKVVEVTKAEPVVIENVQPAVAVKQESTFRFLLNYIHKLLSLFVTVIVTIFENIMWIVGAVIITVAANYFLKEQGINTFTKLIDVVKEIIQQFI